MKKNILIILGLLIPLSYVGAVTFTRWDVNKASYTNVSATTAWIKDSTPGDILVGVNVGSCGGSGGAFRIYDSSSNTTNQLFYINTSSNSANGNDCSAMGWYPFWIPISSGITYTNTVIGGGASDITILWSDVGIGN